MVPNDQPNQFRLSDKGLEPVAADDVPEAPRRRAGGFGDAPKVLILVGLLAVGGAVVAFQFLRGRGPKRAEAMPTGPSAAAPAAVGARDVDAVIADLERKAKGSVAGEELSVAQVERLVEEFDGFVRGRQMPLGEVKENPFVVRLSAKWQPEPPPAPPVEAPVDPSPADRQRDIRARAEQLTVGSILVGGPHAMAVINGHVCAVGDTVGGFRIGAIEPSRVVLDCEGVTVERCLFETVRRPN